MRVTNFMMVDTLLRNLNTNMGKMQKSQEQMSSGRRINRVSDDPVGIISSLRYRTNLTELAKFKSNAEDASSWLETTDTALNDAGNIMQRIRELAVQAAKSPMPDVSYESIVKEVSQLKEELVQVGNSSYAGKYIFSGTMTQTEAFDSTGVYQGNTDAIQYEIGVGVTIPVNANGVDAFGDMFSVIDDLIAAIGPPAGSPVPTRGPELISTQILGKIDVVMDQQLKARADIGSRVNRLEIAVNRMDTQNVNLTDLLSKNEDIDMAKLIMELKVQENVYNSSLAAGARIVQPTLMDFLR